MEDYLISIGFATLFQLIKNPTKLAHFRAAFLKLHDAIEVAFPEAIIPK